MTNKYPKDKLWVFDTQQYLEVYAPTLEDALKQVGKVETVSGLEFTQAQEWEIYQKEYAEEQRKWIDEHGGDEAK